jgi:hypothetical protein
MLVPTFVDRGCRVVRVADPYGRNLDFLDRNCYYVKVKSKSIPVTGLRGLYGCEMLRIPHCLDNRLRDGSKVVSPTYRQHVTPQKHYYFYVSGISVRG